MGKLFARIGVLAMVAALAPAASAEPADKAGAGDKLPYLRELSHIKGSVEAKPFGPILSWASLSPQFALARFEAEPSEPDSEPDPEPLPADEACGFPGMQSPETLAEVAADGVVATLICPVDASATVTLLVSEDSAEYFDLDSREIGSAQADLVAYERKEFVIRPEPEIVEKLSRHGGDTVYFEATVAAEDADGADAAPEGRFGEFAAGD